MNKQKARQGRLTFSMATFLLIALAKISWESKLLLHTKYDTTRELLLHFKDQTFGVKAGKQNTSRMFSAQDGTNTGTLNVAASNKNLLVFYHVYIPAEVQPSLFIIQEQLNQISLSSASKTASGKALIYYNTIGNSNSSLLVENFVGQICNQQNLTCFHANHYEHGFEFYTLRDLHRYCNQNNNRNDTVVYMHNKGSFHPKRNESTHLRRSMMTAVTSHECQRALKDDKCNICGLSFSPWKSPFYPGNFWTAQCQYIQNLLDPFDYRKKAETNRDRVLQMKRRGKLTTSMFPEQRHNWGVYRYAAEFWAGSHPTVRPCDVVSIKHYLEWQERDFQTDQIDLQLAPREPLEEDQDMIVRMPNTTFGRIREYFLLAGYVIRWRRFYSQVAPNDSWFWSYFPDGEAWRMANEKHGVNAVYQMLNYGAY